jgi:plastocyanin
VSESFFNVLNSTRLSRRTIIVGILAATAGSALAACASNGAAAPSTPRTSTQATSNSTGGSAGASGASVVVTMNDQYRYVPDTITIAKGTTVEWKNTSASPHTVTDDPSKAQNSADAVLPSGAEPWDSGLIDPGKSFTRTFTVSGDYTYFCIPHESMGMVGKIKVT